MKLLHRLLAATICGPPLAILTGFENGEVAAVLYDEPKRYVLQTLGWILIVLVVSSRYDLFHPRALAHVLRRPLPLALVAFLIYSAATGLWSRVPENHLHEWHLFLFLFVLLIVLDAWAGADATAGRLALHAYALALVPLTGAGFAQLLIDIPFLPPIDPGYGVRHPSFMGYKNPMALALLGSLFVLAYLTWDSFARRRAAFIRIGLCVYLAATVAYLISLQSRTSIVALVAASTLLLGGFLWIGKAAKGYIMAGSCGAGVLLGLLLLNAPAQARLATLGDYLSQPSTWLESDRGTYLLNTLNMSRHNPFGVGLGDWQTHYPLYRRHQRDLAFTGEIQTRRAHNDHMQMLGELGYPGLALWAAVLAIAMLRPLRHFARTRELRSLFLGAQLLALVVAMAGDYLLDLPYSRFQLFMVFALTLIFCRHEAPRQAPDAPRNRAPALVVAAVTMVAAGHLWYAARGLEKSYHGMMVRLHHQRALTELNAGVRSTDAARHLAAAEIHGDRFASRPGHDKTSYRIYLAMAEAAWWQGRDRRAAELTRRSLELHPFHPGSFLLLSRILADSAPEVSVELAAAHRYLLDEAEDGFRIPYPPLYAGVAR